MKFDTNALSGLKADQAKQKHSEIGDNALSKKESKPWYCVFFEEMTGFFSLLLWFGSFLCFIGYGIQVDKEDKANLYLGIVLAIVTFFDRMLLLCSNFKIRRNDGPIREFYPTNCHRH